MKLDALLEKAELLPRSNTPKAEAIGKQFVATAVKGVKTEDVEALAKKLAKNFYNAMIASIEQDVKNRNTKVVNESTVEFKNIPGALDKDKIIFVDGEEVGTVSRGWLRNGGDQWVVALPDKSAFGGKSLKELKRSIVWQLNKGK